MRNTKYIFEKLRNMKKMIFCSSIFYKISNPNIYMSMLADNTSTGKNSQLMIRKDNLIKNITISKERAESGFIMNDKTVGFKTYKEYTDYIYNVIYNEDEKNVKCIELLYDTINTASLDDWGNVVDYIEFIYCISNKVTILNGTIKDGLEDISKWGTCDMTLMKGIYGLYQIVFFHPRYTYEGDGWILSNFLHVCDDK